MNYIDFSKCKLSNRYYSGSEKKIGIIYNNELYMLKFQKKTPFGFRNNTISEYLGSHIYQMLGIKCQDTLLGTYNGFNVVACKDFVVDDYQFVPFNEVGESSIDVDKEKYQYEYEDIITLINNNIKLTNVEETKSSFFDIYIVDALLGNFDRHGANWGFLKKNNKYLMAPVFDNGSCLFPNLVNEDEINLIVNDEEQIDMRVYKFPTSQIKLNGNKSSYFDIISSLEFSEINKSLLKVYPLIDLEKIYELIDTINISNTHRNFYKVMIKNRYEKILKYSYDKLVGLKK